MNTEPRSFSDLLSEALSQFTKLVRNEIQLAKAEMSVKATQAAMGVGMLVGSALVAIAALVLLLLALAAWLINMGLSEPLSYLIAAVVGLAITGGLAWTGMNRLKPENLAPKRTLDQLQQDAIAVKEHAK